MGLVESHSTSSTVETQVHYASCMCIVMFAHPIFGVVYQDGEATSLSMVARNYILIFVLPTEFE